MKNKDLLEMRSLGWFFGCFVIFQLLFIVPACIAADIIGADDLLRISVYGYEDLKTEARVSTDGLISFPLIGEMTAAGKSSHDLQEDIALKLVKGGYIRNAQVTVSVIDRVSQHVSVLGYVSKPGRYALDSTTSVVDLIAMAGGINEAGSNKVLVTRTINGNLEKHVLDIHDFLINSENKVAFKMQPGDVVYVTKAPLFYIYGEVQHPGGYRLDPDIMIAKALSIGGGLTPRGSENRIHIKRKDETDLLIEIDADLSTQVLKDDVIYVDERWF